MIIYQPTGLVSIYRTIKYEFLLFASALEIIYIEYDVIFDGVTIATDRAIPSRVEPNGMFAGDDYYFEVDVSEYLKPITNPLRSKMEQFGRPNEGAAVESKNAAGDLQLSTRYYFRNASNLIEQASPLLNDLTSRCTAGIISTKNTRVQALNRFAQLPPRVSEFLTDRPDFESLGRGENAFLATISGILVNSFRVELFDSAGVSISEAFQDITGPSDHKSIGVGQLQLENTGSWIGTAPNFSAGNVAYYTIDFGLRISPSGYTQFSPTRTITVGEPCSKKIELAWLNKLGGIDTYRFGLTETIRSKEANTANKPLQWLPTEPNSAHDPADFVRFDYGINSRRSYSLRATATPSVMSWLADLVDSAEVYMRDPNDSTEWLRVVVANGDYTEQRQPNVFDFTLTVTLSQGIINHRN